MSCDDQMSTFQGSSTHVWAPSNFTEPDTTLVQPVDHLSEFFKPNSQPTIDQFSVVTSPRSEFSNFLDNSSKFVKNPLKQNHPSEDHHKKNNMACKKYREKQKERFKFKQDELLELQKINSELNKKLEAKKNEVRQLQSTLIRSMGYPAL